MATPAVAEGRGAHDAGDAYINLSNNVRSLPAGDSSVRTTGIATSTSRRGRSNAARTSQDLDAREDNDADGENVQSAVSSTSGQNENGPEIDNVVAIPGDEMNSHRTLTPLMRIKLSELSTSSSESETEQVVTEEGGDGNEDARRAASPPPNCAICLGRCKNKCFTDSCMHQFCFKCLCEWSKVKPECPLCKQTFKSIIHNVKSIHQFEEYHVQPPTVQIPHRPMEVTIRSLPYIFDAVVVDGHDWELPRRRNSAHRIRPASSGIFFPSALPDASANGDNANSSSGGSMYNHLVYRNELLDMYRQEAPDAIASSGTLSQLWRRFIYDRRLFALPVCDITGRFRESTARFYRDNPAQVHRLMPWINRDIVCLLRNTEHDVSSLLERINESLLQTNILSPAFRRRLQPFLGAKTSHFIHELNNFARSPYDMIGYDRAVHYLPQAPEEIVIEFSSSASSEEENASNDTNEHRTRNRSARTRNDNDFRVLSRAGNSSATGPTGSALLSFTVSTTSEGTEAPGVTVSINGRSGQSAAINLSTHNRVSSDIIELDDSEAIYEAGSEPQVVNGADEAPTTAPTSLSNLYETASTSAGANRPHLSTVTENIELTSSSSDECEFVLERKPPHLRTPELVSLNSESDSDVVFVDEPKHLRKTTFASSGDEAKLEDDKKPTYQIPTAAQANLNVLTTADREELYNVGASTSTGLRSSGGGGRGVKEIFERSRRSTSSRRKRNLRSNKATTDAAQTKSVTASVVHRGKRIYESSCTSSNFESTSSTTSDSDDDEDFTVNRQQRTKSQRSSRKKKPNRSKRKASVRNQSSSNTRSQTTTRTNSRKRQRASTNKTTNRKQSHEAKRFKDEEEMHTDSEYTSDDSQNLIELQRRLQALKEQEKHSETMEKIDKTLNYLIECEQRATEESTPTNAAANNRNRRAQLSTVAEHFDAMQTDELHDSESRTRRESGDSDAQNEQSTQSHNARRRSQVDAPEESLDVAQNLCVTSTNDLDGGDIALDEDNTFSSTVTQTTTTATTVTTTAANNRSISRASATTNNTSYNDNDDNANDIELQNDNADNENCDENDNYNSSETSSTSSSSHTSMSSPSLYSEATSGVEDEEEGGGDGEQHNIANINEDDDGNSLGLQQLLDTESLGDAWLVHQLGGNSSANNEMEMSMAQHLDSVAEANESNDHVGGLSPSRVGEEAVSLPDIGNEVGGIFLNQHDTSLVMPFNYDAEGSQSDGE